MTEQGMIPLLSFTPCHISSSLDFCAVDFLVSKGKSVALWFDRPVWSWGSEEEDVYGVGGTM